MGPILAFLIILGGLLPACQTMQEPVTGEKAYFLTSRQQERQLGEQAYQALLQQVRLADAPQWQSLVARIGGRLVEAAEAEDYDWDFGIFESQELNAVALPNGHILVTSAMLRFVDNEAELAAVIGHEVAHVKARHAGQRIALVMGADFGLRLVEALLVGKSPPQRQLLMDILGVGSQLGAMLPFSREMERESDMIGLHYMAKAGYLPAAAMTLWGRMAVREGEEKGGGPTFLRTHPPSKERLALLQKQLPAVAGFYEKSPRYALGVRDFSN